MTERFNISSLLVVLPLAHLLVTTLYLWCWFTGFGANIGVLAEATDIFRISTTEMVPLYFGGIALPAAASYLRHKAGFSSADARASTIADPDMRAKATSRNDKTRLALIVLACLASIFGMHQASQQYLHGEPITQIWLAFVFPVVAILSFVRKDANFNNLQWEALIVLIGLTMSAITTGIWSGQSARHSEYDRASSSGLHCGSAVILRRVGSSYIAVLKSGQKVVIGGDCKIVMIVPPHR